MFYYAIRLFEPYDGGNDIMIAHEHRYTEFELSSIVQEAIDKVVEEYSKTDYSNSEWCPCNQKINYFPDGLSGYPKGLFGSVLSFLRYDYGFEILGSFDSLFESSDLLGRNFVLTMGNNSIRAELFRKITE